MIHRILITLPLLAVTLFIAACGSSSKETSSEETAGETPSPKVIVRQYFGENGNLWKPKSDEGSSSAGLLVVLLGSQFTGRFDSCELKLADGSTVALDCNDRVEWSHTPFSCIANGGREHWRSPILCSLAAEVKVTCRNFTEEVIFRARGAAIDSVCGRHG